jgi:tRNA modification GTPase
LIKQLRQQLLDFASLLELELDFSEEDVEFANRVQLENLVRGLLTEVIKLRNSFATGNVMKLGIPVVIAGKPNVGKSTLLNALLNEEKAIVSDIAGTTRDVIEDQIILHGLRFRFIDTAGLRKTEDTIEKIGVGKSYEQVVKAEVLLYLCDPGQSSPQELQEELVDLKFQTGLNDEAIILVINKVDQYETTMVNYDYSLLPRTVFISAKTHSHLDDLKEELLKIANKLNDTGDAALVTNARHAEALSSAESALTKVIEGIHHQLSTDLLALELKDALYHLGQITGEIYTDDLLGNIFSKFCIGK